MRIAVHDYAGHPFEFELTRELSARGHEARHFYFAGDHGPKGRVERRDDDPAGYSIEPLNVSRPYDKRKLLLRWQLDREYGATAAAAITAFKPDVVISGNTPLDAQSRLLRTSHKAGAPFIFWMQDMISALADQQLGHRWRGVGALVANHYKRLERNLVEKSDGVVLISADFSEEMERMGMRPAPTAVIPNWGAIDEIPTRPHDNDWAERVGVAGKRTLLYSGTLGVKHSPLMLVDLADALADQPDVTILIASAGQGLDEVRAELARRPRPNIQIEPLQPMEVFPEVLGSADVLIALLEKDAGRFCVPSKVLSYLCAGRPILLAAPEQNLSASVLADAGAGRVVPAGDSAAFVAAAKQLLADAGERAAAGARARDYAERSFDIRAVADRFEELIARVFSRQARAA
jgi:colanic acid biosynthesis glycosyl transferase WcaI